MIVAGLDEAALGPKLGPFTACLIRFRSAHDDASSDLYYRLAEVISPDTGTGKIAVGDSKKLYSPAIGTALLETTVLAFLEAGGFPRPSTFRQLLEFLAPEDAVEALETAPWYEKAEDLRLPVTAETGSADPVRSSAEAADRLAGILAREDITFMTPVMRFITAAKFNRYIEDGRGKARAVQTILAPLMSDVLDSEDEAVFTMDRQGGRRYYGEWLAELAPGGRLAAGEEGPLRSSYRAGPHRVTFLVKADAVHLEVALASMFAKYVRELAMGLFNEWWSRRVPGIRSTAGYPQDARRFVADLEAGDAVPADRDLLIRRL